VVGAEPLTKRKARLEAAKRGLAQLERGRAGGMDPGLVRVWARRVADAELAICSGPVERKAVLEAYVRRAKDAERAIRNVNRTGAVTLMELLEGEFFRADAEVLLAEEEALRMDER
jgi:hypothetical protein